MSTRNASRGQAMVEFALVVPLFILLLVGLFDVGRAVYAYNTVNNAAREAGRLAIVDQFEAHVQAEGAGAASGLGIAADDVVVEFQEVNGTTCTALGSASVVRCVAVVTVPYDYQAATPLIGNIVGTIAISGQSRFPISVNCAASTCPLGSQP
jgi:Flp pilus assembly protein TadG